MVCSAPPRRLGKWICVQLPECEVGVERAGKRPRTTSRSVHLFNRSVLSPGSPHGHGPGPLGFKNRITMTGRRAGAHRAPDRFGMFGEFGVDRREQPLCCGRGPALGGPGSRSFF